MFRDFYDNKNNQTNEINGSLQEGCILQQPSTIIRQYIAVPTQQDSLLMAHSYQMTNGNKKWIQNINSDRSKNILLNDQITTLKIASYTPTRNQSQILDIPTKYRRHTNSLSNFKKLIENNMVDKRINICDYQHIQNYTKVTQARSPAKSQFKKHLKQMNVSPIRGNQTLINQNSLTETLDLSIQQQGKQIQKEKSKYELPIFFEEFENEETQGKVTSKGCKSSRTNNLFYQFLENTTCENSHTYRPQVPSEKKMSSHTSNQFSREFSNMEQKILSRQQSTEKMNTDDRKRSSTMLLNCLQQKLQKNDIQRSELQRNDMQRINLQRINSQRSNLQRSELQNNMQDVNESKKKFSYLLEQHREAEQQILSLQNSKMDLQNMATKMQTRVYELNQHNTHLKNLNEKMDLQIKQQDDQAKMLKKQLTTLHTMEQDRNDKIQQIEVFQGNIIRYEQESQKQRLQIEDLKKQTGQYQQIESHIQELEKIYNQSVFKLKPVIINQIQTLGSTNELMESLDQIIQRLTQGKDLPIQLLVQHRKTLSKNDTDQSIKQTQVSNSYDFKQLREMMQEVSIQIRMLYERIKNLIDSMAEHCIHDLTKALSQNE